MRTILDKGCLDCREEIVLNDRHLHINKQFDRDLLIGKKIEARIQKRIEEDLCEVCDELAVEDNCDARFDLAVHCNNRSVRVEIKDDRASLKTGNICLEFNSYGKVSGVFSPTYEAEVLIYKSGDTLYLLDSERVKRICIRQYNWTKQGKSFKGRFYSRIVSCGDPYKGGKSGKGFLIPLDMVKKVAFQIINL